MVCYCLDLRGDGKMSKFLGNKVVSVIAGIVQLIIWVVGLFNLIFPSGPLQETLQQNSGAVKAVSIVLALVIIGFSVLLLFGLFKDRPGFIKTYLISNVVFTSLFVISFFLNLFLQPTRFGISGFLSMFIMILLNILFFFIIRNYYLAFISREPKGGTV